jgi:hypothetical protein
LEETKAPYWNPRRLITDFDVDRNANKAHGIVVWGERWKTVWKYLFTHPVGEVGKPVTKDPDCVVQKAH